MTNSRRTLIHKSEINRFIIATHRDIAQPSQAQKDQMSYQKQAEVGNLPHPLAKAPG